MDVIQGGASQNGPANVEHGRIWWFWHMVKLHLWHWRLKRWIPHLVWLGDEINVQITFIEDPLIHGAELHGLFSGGLYEIQKRLLDMGISFDSGCGAGGRDWEFDWSLQGPVRVKFRGRATRPELRVRREPPPSSVKLVS